MVGGLIRGVVGPTQVDLGSGEGCSRQAGGCEEETEAGCDRFFLKQGQLAGWSGTFSTPANKEPGRFRNCG